MGFVDDLPQAFRGTGENTSLSQTENTCSYRWWANAHLAVHTELDNNDDSDSLISTKIQFAAKRYWGLTICLYASSPSRSNSFKTPSTGRQKTKYDQYRQHDSRSQIRMVDLSLGQSNSTVRIC